MKEVKRTMANANIINAKAELVAGLKEKIQGCQSVVIVDYRGYTVAEDTELRNNFASYNITCYYDKDTDDGGRIRIVIARPQ